MIINKSNSYSTDSTELTATNRSAKASQSAPFSEFISSTSGFDISNMTTAKLKGRLLETAPLILPTFDNMQTISSQLNEKLAGILNESGISSDPPFNIKMNYETNSLEVSGGRADIDRISELLNGNSEIKNMIQTSIAIGSHVSQMEDSFKFQKEYLASDNPQSVVSKYSYLFGGAKQTRDFSLQYGNDGLKLLSDGQVWTIPSAA